MIAGDLLRSKNDPTDHVGIFALLYVRLACLQISGLHEVAAQESKALQDLNAPVYRDPGSGRHLVPWDLRVLCVRLQSLGFDDWRRGIMAYYDLAREARFQSKHATESQQQWINRLQDISIRIASALVEMEDLSAAARFLESLPSTTDARSSQRLALIWLNIGDVEQARLCIKHGESGSNESQQGILEALCSMADGDLDGAIERFRRLETSAAPESHPIVAQSLGACLVYTSKIKEVRPTLRSHFPHNLTYSPPHHPYRPTAPSFSHPPNHPTNPDLKAKHLLEASTANNTTNTPTIPSDTLFNLSTIYELCSNDASAQKAALAARVAGMEPRLERGMNGTKVWQRGAGEFKL